MDEVIKIINSPLSEHIGGFVALLIFSALFYMVFARLREQVCTTICPYGRLQGVLLVKDSIVVAYDHVRGEPRSKRKRTETATTANLKTNGSNSPVGDCIDCGLCVRVCPTGIDIRNGTQLECTNCTACIDACDDIMTGIETRKRKIFTTRVYAYTAVLVALLALDVVLISSRGIVESIILRSPGMLYQQKDETHLTNLYTYVLINKTSTELPVQIQISTEGGKIQAVGKEASTIPKGGKIEGAFFVEMPTDKLLGRKTPINIEVLSNGKVIDKVKTNFMGPTK
jgi:cytochrome c oxidase accessory protein FixG